MKQAFVRGHLDTVERCARRCRETAERDISHFPDEHDRMDVMALDLIRLCESMIDLAKHMAKTENLGLIEGARDAFQLVAAPLGITKAEANQMADMVGFRNLAVHNYAAIEESVIEFAIANRLGLPIRIARAIGTRAGLRP